ncbi:MAG: hypothetical protein WCV84_00190 [Patescibacteria group bacterium]
MKRLALFVTSLLGTTLALPAAAVCPVCAVAVGAGIGLSRWLGVDDTITGLWVGGLTMAFAMWTINWLDKKKITFRYRDGVTMLGWYLLAIAPLYFMGVFGHPFNQLWGMDKLALTIVLGTGAFYGMATWYEHLKKQNNNKAYFPFQKVAMPVGGLAVLSAIFYLITR